MPLVIGKIESINEETTKSYIKKEIELVGREGKCFVEFRGVQRFLLKDFNVGDIVIVSFSLDGKTSKLGKNFDNLVGTSIEKI